MLTRTNSQKWVNNTLIFIRPVLLIYLGYVSTNIGANGFVVSDLVPNAFIVGGMVLYVVNVLTDYLRKLELQRELEIIETTPVTPAIAPPVQLSEQPEPLPSTPVDKPLTVEDPIA